MVARVLHSSAGQCSSMRRQWLRAARTQKGIAAHWRALEATMPGMSTLGTKATMPGMSTLGTKVSSAVGMNLSTPINSCTTQKNSLNAHFMHGQTSSSDEQQRQTWPFRGTAELPRRCSQCGLLFPPKGQEPKAAELRRQDQYGSAAVEPDKNDHTPRNWLPLVPGAL